MRTHSTFEFTCVCGLFTITKDLKGKCKRCGREYEVQWGRGPSRADPKVKTISEVYEEDSKEIR